MTTLAWVIFITAAMLEVGGDALIRYGLRGQGLLAIIAGFLILGCYGLVVNRVPWDFSRLLGVYIAVFALVSVLTGWLVFREVIPFSTWLGLAFIILGGVVIQYGPH